MNGHGQFYSNMKVPVENVNQCTQYKNQCEVGPSQLWVSTQEKFENDEQLNLFSIDLASTVTPFYMEK